VADPTSCKDDCPVLLTAADAATYLQLDVPVVLRAMADGTLPTVRRDGVTYVPVRALLLWLGCPEHALPDYLRTVQAHVEGDGDGAV